MRLILLAVPLLTAALPPQAGGGRPVPADVVADLKRYEHCDDARKRQLDGLVRAGFSLPGDCDVRVLNCRYMPGADSRPLRPDELRIEMEVTITDSPHLTLRVLGDLVPAHAVRLGFSARGFPGGECPRGDAACLVVATRNLLRDVGGLASKVVAIDGFSDSLRSMIRYRLKLAVGTALIGATFDVPFSPPASAAPALRGFVEQVRIAFSPLVTGAEPTKYNHAYVSGRSDEMRLTWQGMTFDSWIVGGHAYYRVAGIELCLPAMQALGEAAHRQHQLGRKVWDRTLRVHAFVAGRGFLFVRCPLHAPAALVADGADVWLTSNAQAVLLVAKLAADGRVLSLDPRPQVVAVRGGPWPKPFVIEVPGLDLRAVWANPEHRNLPKLEGPSATLF